MPQDGIIFHHALTGAVYRSYRRCRKDKPPLGRFSRYGARPYIAALVGPGTVPAQK